MNYSEYQYNMSLSDFITIRAFLGHSQKIEKKNKIIIIINRQTNRPVQVFYQISQ